MPRGSSVPWLWGSSACRLAAAAVTGDYMAERYDDFRNQVAFVTHTRDYRSSDLLPALARHGYTTTERPHDRETERLLAQFDPDLVVLAIDPRQENDVQLIRAVNRVCQAAVM